MPYGQFESLDAGLYACHPASDVLMFAEWNIFAIHFDCLVQVRLDYGFILAVYQYRFFLDLKEFLKCAAVVDKHVSCR